MSIRPVDSSKPRLRRRPVKVKRVYDAAHPSDGVRVLVDRLWPRGVSKARAAADLWLKDAAPSDGLRRWYGHDPRRWRRFSRKYRAELGKRDAVLRVLHELRRRGSLTLIYGARDSAHSHALVLRDLLEKSTVEATRAKE